MTGGGFIGLGLLSTGFDHWRAMTDLSQLQGCFPRLHNQKDIAVLRSSSTSFERIVGGCEVDERIRGDAA